ncbi:hypothetical protein CABS03_11396 [Colletotrichum abscissum]
MKHEALDPVNEGDNVNNNLADADIANASDNANLPAPTSMGLASQNVNTSPDALHGDGRSASATSAKKPAVAAAAAPFGGRLRVRDPFSGRLVRVPQMRPSVHAQELARSCESPHCILFIDILTNPSKALPDSAPRYELSSGAMRP